MRRLQKTLEALARDRAIAQGPNISVGMIAVDNESGDVLARVGSSDYFDERRAGQVDMTRAVRSPGSTLKPFIYGLAFEDGFVHPDSLIDDRPIRFGTYAPENFDMTFQGTVPIRRALQLSLNVPAIALLDRVGASRLSSRLKQAGGSLVLPKDEAPGLAMGLGGVGVTLQDLAQLYTGFPRLGTTKPLREIMTATDDREPMRLMDQAAAWQVGNVLMGTPPPENGVHNKIAFKTGTSYGYRDAWSVGFDGRITIAVWVGRPDGAPVPGLVGRTAAAPILFDAFARTGKIPAALPKPPKSVLLASNAKLPLPLRRFRPVGELIRTGADQAPHIQFPLNGSRIDVERSGGRAGRRDAGQGRRRRAAADHDDQRYCGRRNRQPPPAAGRPARAGFCPADGDRRDRGGGYGRDPGAVRERDRRERGRTGNSGLFALRFHRMRNGWLKPRKSRALEQANSL